MTCPPQPTESNFLTTSNPLTTSDPLTASAASTEGHKPLAEWLRDIGLAEYAESFEENEIVGEHLLELKGLKKDCTSEEISGQTIMDDTRPKVRAQLQG